MTEMGDSAEAAAEIAVDDDPLMVFQCGKCGVILGDSLAWVSGNTDIQSIALNRVTDAVIVQTTPLTSTRGEDLGSTYVGIKCVKCGSDIGRIYKTTPQNLDEIRDMYTLLVTKVNSYPLGSGTPSPALDQQCTNSQKQMQITIKKIQALMLSFNNRLMALEAAVTKEDHNQNDINSQHVHSL